jgi:hypothetical protein
MVKTKPSQRGINAAMRGLMEYLRADDVDVDTAITALAGLRVLIIAARSKQLRLDDDTDELVALTMISKGSDAMLLGSQIPQRSLRRYVLRKDKRYRL